jgi:hypothetical protein
VAEVLPFDDPSNYSTVLRSIRRLWHEGAVTFHVHAVRAMQRRHLTFQDVEHVLLHGDIVEHNRPRTAWRWKVLGRCLDEERPASCVVQIELEGRLLIITVIDETNERGTP